MQLVTDLEARALAVERENIARARCDMRRYLAQRACPYCAPELFDAGRTRVPEAVFCPQHVGRAAHWAFAKVRQTG